MYIFRADASLEIGSGHIMRCLSLAEILLDRGEKVVFLCRSLPESFIELFTQKNIQLIQLYQGEFDLEKDIETTIHALYAYQQDPIYMITDHYQLDKQWESSINPHIEKMIVIDELADRQHQCDIIIDQNIKNRQSIYANLVPENCQILSGPKYIILHKSFQTVAKKPRKSVKEIFICFGGIDQKGRTISILHECQYIDFSGKIVHVVAGKSNPHLNEIEVLCKKLQFQFHCQPSNLVELMAKADFAIGAGGTMTWERIALGLPSLVFSIADNQDQQIQDCATCGLIYAPKFGVKEHIQALMASPYFLQHMSKTCLSSLDTKGVQHILDHIIPSQIELVSACLEDAELIFSMRNHPNIRKNSIDDREISYEEHVSWFKQSLENRTRYTLLAKYKADIIGLVRFDIHSERSDTVIDSIYMHPDHIGKGLGKQLYRVREEWLKNHLPEIHYISSQVMEHNKTAQHILQSIGFEPKESRWEKAL